MIALFDDFESLKSIRRISENVINAGINWHAIIMHLAGNDTNITFKSRESMIKI